MTFRLLTQLVIFVLVLISVCGWSQEFVKINGNQIHYEVKGSGSPAIIFVSGYGDPLTSFDSVFNKLSTLTTVIRYDRSGLGKSGYENSTKDFDDIVLELALLIQHLNVSEKVILVGHSYGGLIIRAYAKQHPEKVCGLLFDDSTFENYFDLLTPLQKNAEQIEMKEHADLHADKAVDDEFNSLWKVWHSPANWKKWFEPMPRVPTVVLTSMKINEEGGLRGNKQLMEARYQAQSKCIKNKPYSAQIGIESAGHYIHNETPSVFIESVIMLLNFVRDGRK